MILQKILKLNGRKMNNKILKFLFIILINFANLCYAQDCEVINLITNRIYPDKCVMVCSEVDQFYDIEKEYFKERLRSRLIQHANENVADSILFRTKSVTFFNNYTDNSCNKKIKFISKIEAQEFLRNNLRMEPEKLDSIPNNNKNIFYFSKIIYFEDFVFVQYSFGMFGSGLSSYYY